MEHNEMNAQLDKVADVIKVSTEFSRTPGGRYYTDGPASGEQFREEFLLPALRAHDNITIDLDGARGYPSSFLEEAFGGAVRKLRLSPQEFLRRVKFKADGDFQIYVEDIKFHLNRAANGR
jgi:hypothetical protein